ncbi:Glycoside hydrolase family 3 [Lasiodiplodia theobromae]|uniref:Glycoside hydrolase family 3 n=1 Tax=Lasiodiplodia theobromae TaxID=45133 RepID=UPI0015C40052|nr:Glycoside hydrolase family 3 [Lasiodiplodia theobromae]KAF4535218.1 Glycoside hydrolase family 3 [Lasiodiplodia theobromae]
MHRIHALKHAGWLAFPTAEWSILTEDTSCNTPCPGNASATCGASYFIDVYKIQNPSAAPVNPAFPDCSRQPLCGTAICDTTLTPLKRAQGLVSLMNSTEKVQNLVNSAPGVPRLGVVPYQWWNEGLHGYAYSKGLGFTGSGDFSSATSFPQVINIGAAFDDNLVYSIATVISTETRAFSNRGLSGLDLWTPNIDPFKDPRWGRGPETPGEDPFHLQSYVQALLHGLEQPDASGHRKTVATCKHYAANDLEELDSGITRYSFDAQISAQDLSEYYLPPFKSCAVDSNVGAFMCSYNAVNGDCDAVKVIETDHHFTNTSAEAAAVAFKAGTDLVCANSDWDGIQEAYDQNLLTDADLDRALSRLYASLVKIGYFDPADDQPYRQLGWESVNTLEAQRLAYDAAVAGTVLIKNDGILPLAKNKSIALIGPWANATTQMQGNYYGTAPYLKSPLSAAQALGIHVAYVLGSGINTPDPSASDAITAARNADVTIFMGGIDTSIETEMLDRDNLTWPDAQLSLIRSLRQLGKPTVVVQMGGGQIDDSELLSGNGSVNALLWAGYPGQEGGAALLDVIVGNAAPAGRLPVTQYPASYAEAVPATDMALRPGAGNAGLGRTYMWYTEDPVVRFGYGLHYTTFDFAWTETPSSTISIQDLVGSADEADWATTLRKTALSVSLAVTNTGTATSDYVSLLFMNSTAGPDPHPKKTLIAYTRAHDIAAGETSDVSLSLTVERLVRVDETGSRVLYPGTYTVFLDLSSELSFDFTLTGEAVTVERFPSS